MGAALELEQPAYRGNYDTPIPPDPGDLDTIAHADRCRQVWILALRLYLQDARAGLESDAKESSREALEDLTSPDAPMLARLCEMLDFDPEWIRAGIIQRVDNPGQ